MGRFPIVNASISPDQLIQILARESAQCDLLAQNIVHERDAVKRLALQEFHSINQVRTSILNSLGLLREELDVLLRALEERCHVPAASRTLSEILHQAYGTQADVVLQQYERLAEKARAVKQDIAVNQLLIKNVQSFLMRAAEAYRQGPQEDELYSASGVRGTAVGQAVMLKRKG